MKKAVSGKPLVAGLSVSEVGPRLLGQPIWQVLRRQQDELPAAPARDEQLAGLRAGGSLVVTGQQVGLFLGPLYTFYKAATAVRLAQSVAAATGRACAPLFWLQTEDHDRAEVDHCFLPDPAGGPPQRVALADDGEHANVSLAHRPLGPSVLACLATLESALEGLPEAAATMELFARAYRPERTFGQAFATVLATLFAEDGLLVLDPRDAELQRQAAPLYRRCLARGPELAALLEARGVELRGSGEPAPVHVRPRAPLFFFHPRGAAGPRYRLEPLDAAGERFGFVGAPGVVSREELLAQLERDPLTCSSSALLRPLVQDALLPAEVLVAGPSELAYLAQLPPLYRALDIVAARPVRRAGFVLLEQPTRRALAALGLEARAVCAGEGGALEELLARRAVAADEMPPEVLEQQLLSALETKLDAFEPSARALHAAVAVGVDKTRRSVRRSVARLTGRYRRALAARDEVARDRLRRVQAALRPGGAPQERVFSLPAFLAAHGIGELRRRVLAAIDDPLAGRTLELVL